MKKEGKDKGDQKQKARGGNEKEIKMQNVTKTALNMNIEDVKILEAGAASKQYLRPGVSGVTSAAGQQFGFPHLIPWFWSEVLADG